MKKNVLKTIGIIALLLVVYMSLQGIFSFVGVVIMMVAYAAGSGAADFGEAMSMFNEAGVQGLPEALRAYTYQGMALGLFLSTVAMLLFMHFAKFYRMRLSIFSSIKLKPLFYSTLLVFTSMFALNILVQWFSLVDSLENEFDALTHTFLGALTISVLAPLLEEVLFRGAIQGYVMRRVKYPWVAIVVAALVFGVIHLNPVQIAYATLLGVVFGWLYYRTGSLLSVVVGHVLNNTLATIMMLTMGNTDESELLQDVLSPAAQLGSEIAMFVVFALISLQIALKLHRMLPTPPQPWRESNEPVECVADATPETAAE